MAVRTVKKICLMLFLILGFASLSGISEGAATTQTTAGFSREIIANFVGVMNETKPAQKQVPMSREIIANFVGVMNVTQSAQPHDPLSREIIANFVGTIKSSPQAQIPVDGSQAIKNVKPSVPVAPEILKKK